MLYIWHVPFMWRGISERAVRHQFAIFVSLSLWSTTWSVKPSRWNRCEQLATSELKCGIILGSGFINPRTFCPTFSQTVHSGSEFTTTASATYDIFYITSTYFDPYNPQFNTIIHSGSNCGKCMPLEYSYLFSGSFFETGTHTHSKFQMRRVGATAHGD